MRQRPRNHQPHRLDKYLQTHDTILGRFVDTGFVHPAYTVSLFQYETDFLMQGEVGCQGEIIVSVFKRLASVGEPGEAPPFVQTEAYSYNARVFGAGNIVRYDNLHPNNLHEGHRDEHHKHVFDWRTSEELPGSPKWIGAMLWPTLGDVLWELRDWHATNYNSLPNPGSFPKPEQLLTEIRL